MMLVSSAASDPASAITPAASHPTLMAALLVAAVPRTEPVVPRRRSAGFYPGRAKSLCALAGRLPRRHHPEQVLDAVALGFASGGRLGGGPLLATRDGPLQGHGPLLVVRIHLDVARIDGLVEHEGAPDVEGQ